MLWDEWPDVPKEIQTSIPGRTYLTTWPAHWTIKTLSKKFGPYGIGWGVSDSLSEILFDGKIYSLKANFWYVLDGERAQFPIEIWDPIDEFGPKKHPEDTPKSAHTALISKAALYLGIGDEVVSKEKPKGEPAPPPERNKPLKKAVEKAMPAQPPETEINTALKVKGMVNVFIKRLEEVFSGTYADIDPETKELKKPAEAMMKVMDATFGTDMISGKHTLATLYERSPEEIEAAIKEKSKAAVELELEGWTPF